MRTNCGIVLVVVMFLGAGTALGGEPPVKSASFFDVFKKLCEGKALSESLLKDSLDVYLTEDKSQSNDFFTFYLGKPRAGSAFEPLVASVDFRVPKTAGKGPFLYIEFKQKAGLPVAELEKRFGKPSQVDMEPPPNPIPVIYAFKVGPGSVRFGLDSDQKLVFSATIDRIQ